MHLSPSHRINWSRIAAAPLLIILALCMPELVMAQASPFLTGASSLQTNSRVAREYLVALPAELPHEHRLSLVRGFSHELVERYRFALDVAIHSPRDFADSDPRNFHAHLLATTREVTTEGLGPKTTVEWSDANRRAAGMGPAINELLYVRQLWAEATNAALQEAHLSARIDHRTLAAQGIDREPTPHIPRAAFEMERHGHRSALAERIREEHQARVESRLQRSALPVAAATEPKSIDELQKQSAENWRRWRDSQAQPQPNKDHAASRTRDDDHSL